MTFVEIVKFLNILSPIVMTGGLLIGLYFYSKINSLHRDILLYLFLMLGVDIASRLLFYKYQWNLIILPVFSFIELVFFIYFYKKYLFKSRQWGVTIIGLTGAVYIIAEIFFYFILNNVDAKQFQPYSKVIDNFVVILFSLVFFHEKINRFRESKWDHFPLNIVILVFFTINLIFFLPFNFLINESTGLKFYFWLGNLIITVLFYIYLIYSVWINANEVKPSSYKRKIK